MSRMFTQMIAALTQASRWGKWQPKDRATIRRIIADLKNLKATHQRMEHK